jgi:hypothetical protein
MHAKKSCVANRQVLLAVGSCSWISQLVFGQKHIRLLHEYNETRDAAQVLFGQLATLEGLTIQDVYGKQTRRGKRKLTSQPNSFSQNDSAYRWTTDNRKNPLCKNN